MANNGGWQIVDDAAPAGGWSVVEDAPDPWQPTQYGFKVKPTKLPNGASTLEREDGAVWQSAKTGYKGQDGEGWKYLDPKTNLYAPAPDTLGQNKYLGADSWKGFGRNLAQGLSRPGDAVLGLGHDIAHAVGMEGDQAYLKNIQNMEEREKYRQAVKNTSGQGAGATQLIGETLPTVAAMAAVPEAAAGSTFVQRAAANAIPGAAVSYFTTPGSGMDRTKAAAAALVTAPIAQGIIEKGVIPAAGKVINAVKGVMRPEAKAMADLADKYGVRVSAGDITGNPGIKKTEVLLENAPGAGMTTFRKAQDEEAKKAAKDLVDNLNQSMLQQGWDSLSDIRQAAAKGSKKASAVLALVDDAGDDWNKIIKASGNLKLFSQKLKADRLYGKVDQLAGAEEVPMVNTIRAIEEARQQIKSSALPDESALKLLDKLQGNLDAVEPVAAQAASVSAGAPNIVPFGTAGAPPSAPRVTVPESTVDRSYSGLRSLRSDLGDIVNDYYKGANGLTGSKGVGVIQKVRDAVEQDMDAFAQAKPGLRAAWKEADRFYKTEVVPYKSSALSKAMKDEPADTIYKTFLKNTTTSGQAQRFYNALDPRGQAAVRVGMVQNAFGVGNVPVKGSDAVAFSPAKFAKALEDMSSTSKVVFRGPDKWELDGLTKLMRHVERAGQFSENPPTGNRLAQMAVGGGLANAALFGHPVAAAGGWVTAAALEKALTTSAGKRLLLAASDLQPGSKAMENLIQTQLPRLLGVTAGKTQEPK